MNAGELLAHWRSEVSDQAAPFLWSDDEALLYMLDAYRMFVRLTGGVADYTGDATRIDVSTGSAETPISRSVLRIMKAYMLSDGRDVRVMNQTDLTAQADTDYGTILRNLNAPRPGTVREMVIGRQKGLAHFTAIPEEDDTIQMSIYRLPAETALDESSELTDVDDEHHLHLVSWMKHRAYRKHDVETLDLDKSEKFEKEFRAYCAFVKKEWERLKHKNREVQYGGI